MDPWGTSLGFRAEFVPSLLDNFCPKIPYNNCGFVLCPSHQEHLLGVLMYWAGKDPSPLMSEI